MRRMGSIALMLDQPSMIRRPVLDVGGRLTVGAPGWSRAREPSAAIASAELGVITPIGTHSDAPELPTGRSLPLQPSVVAGAEPARHSCVVNTSGAAPI